MKESDTIYVGIDFSKEKFNVCMRMRSEVMGEAEFPNTTAGYLKLTRWVKRTSGLGKGFCPDNVLFCGEHTGQYSLGLSEYLYARGLRMWLENPLVIKNCSGMQRRKDDRADAQMIALYAERFYQEDVARLFVPETPELKKLRSLYNFRQRMVHDRVAIGNALSSGTYDYSSTAKRQMAKRQREGIEDEKEILKEMVELMTGTPELAANYRILISFNGIGPLTAALLLIHTSNFSRFDDPRKFACFCGIAPFGKQSGTSLSTQPHVSRFAHVGVKAALVESARSAMRTNPIIREYSARLRDKGKHEGVIVNNVKNKIVHIAFKMIASQTEWDDQYERTHPGANQNPKPSEDAAEKEATQCARQSDIGGNQSPRHLGVTLKKGATEAARQSDIGGNQSPRHLGVTLKKGATEAAPESDMGVQTSPSALGGTAKLKKSAKNSKLSKIFT